MDDVGSAAVQYLSGIPGVTDLVGAFGPGDTTYANIGTPWIFLDDQLAQLQGTGLAALVCSSAGGWSSPVPYATQRFTRLAVSFWVDPSRDAALNVTETPGATILRGENLFAVVNSFLHRRDPDTQVWGDLVTTGCALLAEGQFVSVPSGDGDWLQVKQSFYGVTTSGWTDVAV